MFSEKLKEAQTQAEQGSMQLQGEAQELAIEEWLGENFPLDNIIEIKKGARGGDCIQQVHSSMGDVCGEIYYESKRTKAFQSSWIEKFKVDMRERGVQIGVLITQTMPRGMERAGELNGVWVCSYDEFKNLSTVLRASVIRHHGAIKSQENKGDKMNMLYSYLTGDEFRMSVESILDGFSEMESDLSKEKTATQLGWKRREKSIRKVLECTAGMYGSIQGIAGSDVISLELLETQT